jgi:hypothetical protein
MLVSTVTSLHGASTWLSGPVHLNGFAVSLFVAVHLGFMQLLCIQRSV